MHNEINYLIGGISIANFFCGKRLNRFPKLLYLEFISRSKCRPCVQSSEENRRIHNAFISFCITVTRALCNIIHISVQLIYGLRPSSGIIKAFASGTGSALSSFCKLRLYCLKCCCKCIYSHADVISNYDAANMLVRVADLAWFNAYAVFLSVIKWKPYVYVRACVCFALLKV